MVCHSEFRRRRDEESLTVREEYATVIMNLCPSLTELTQLT